MHPGWRPQTAASHHGLAQVRPCHSSAFLCPVRSLGRQPRSPKLTRRPRLCRRLHLCDHSSPPRHCPHSLSPLISESVLLEAGGRIVFVFVVSELGTMLGRCLLEGMSPGESGRATCIFMGQCPLDHRCRLCQLHSGVMSSQPCPCPLSPDLEAHPSRRTPATQQR